MIAVSTWALWSVGEQRVDAYVALYVLEYAIIKAVLRPRRRGVDWLFVALLVVFFVIASYRIYQVLVGL
ncbi:MAG: hypothetical protein ACP5KA_06020 [Desulfurococcaceae archaeon]